MDFQQRLHQLAQSRAPMDWLASNPLEYLAKVEGGTLFLREIANLSKLEQPGLSLLISRLDKHNMRLFCSSSHALVQRVAEHAFDAELYQRRQPWKRRVSERWLATPG